MHSCMSGTGRARSACKRCSDALSPRLTCAGTCKISFDVVVANKDGVTILNPGGWKQLCGEAEESV